MAKAVCIAEKSNDGTCPECGAGLVIRSGRHGHFLGCSDYPTCQYIRPLKANVDGHIVKVLDGQMCPKCESVLVLRQGRYGMFISCQNYPQCDHTEVIDKPQETSLLCPQCRKGHLLQRKSRFGKIFHACDRYPECQFAINNRPEAGKCSWCDYPLLMEKKTVQGMKLFCASKLCGKLVETNDKN